MHARIRRLTMSFDRILQKALQEHRLDGPDRTNTLFHFFNWVIGFQITHAFAWATMQIEDSLSQSPCR